MHKSIKYYNTDFHNDGYSIMMSEKYFYFRKKTKTFEIFSELCVAPISVRYLQKLERNQNNSDYIKGDNFRKFVNF